MNAAKKRPYLWYLDPLLWTVLFLTVATVTWKPTERSEPSKSFVQLIWAGK